MRFAIIAEFMNTKMENSMFSLCNMYKTSIYFSFKEKFLMSVQFSSSVMSSSLLPYPMDCSMPGFAVHHQIPELAQTHGHWVGDTIQPSYPLSSPSPAFSLSQNQGLFQWVSSSHQMAKILELQPQPFNEYSGLIPFRIDWFDLLAVQGTLRSLLQHHSSKHQFFSAQFSL